MSEDKPKKRERKPPTKKVPKALLKFKKTRQRLKIKRKQLTRFTTTIVRPKKTPKLRLFTGAELR